MWIIAVARQQHPQPKTPMTTIEQVRREVERSVRQVVSLSEGKAGTAAEAWTACLTLGRVVMTAYFAHRAA